MNQEHELDASLLSEIANLARVMSADGRVADYIPELSFMSPELFSLSCQPLGNPMVETGDSEASLPGSLSQDPCSWPSR